MKLKLNDRYDCPFKFNEEFSYMTGTVDYEVYCNLKKEQLHKRYKSRHCDENCPLKEFKEITIKYTGE